MVVAGNGIHHPLVDAVTLGKFCPDNGVSTFNFVVNGFAQVVQQAAHLGNGNVRAKFTCDHPRKVGSFDAVGVLVLSIAGAELETPQQFDDLRVQARYACLVSRRLALLADDLIDFFLGVVYELLNSCRVDTPIYHQFAQRALGNLAANWIKTGNRHGFGCIVNDHINSRRLFKRTNIATIAPDNAALHLVGGQCYYTHGKLTHLIGSDALNCQSDDITGAAISLELRFLVNLADFAGHIGTSIALHGGNKFGASFFLRHLCNAFQRRSAFFHHFV